MTLQLGTSKVDITPSFPVELAGFDFRKGSFIEIKAPLYLRMFYFEKKPEHTVKQTTILITADLIWWDADHCKRMEQFIRERYQLNQFAIVFHATHTHSGPQTSANFTRLLGVPNSRYLAFLTDQLLEAVQYAQANLEPVTIEKGSTTCDIGVHRRLSVANRIKMAPNEEGLVDPEVTILLARNRTGGIKGVLVHYACHPTTTGENNISSEFPGIAVAQLEVDLGSDVQVGYLQGCCGDIRPALIDRETKEFYRGNHVDVQRLGRQLATRVEQAIREKEFQVIQTGKLGVKKKAISLPFEQIPSTNELRRMRASFEQKEHKDWCTFLLENPNKLQRPDITLELTFVTFGDGLSFLTMNAEMVVAYGLFIKNVDPNVLPLPYCNGMIGYISTSQQRSEGGYEAEDYIYYFGLPSPLSNCCEEKIQREIQKLVKEGR